MRTGISLILWLAAPMFALWSLAPNAAAAEFEKSTPYYEDDAWYDVSEWLDGNDYNPTDEVVGKWDDEKYNANTASSDSDNDTNRTAKKTAINDKQNANNAWSQDYDQNGRYADYGNPGRSGNYDFASIYYDYDRDGYCDALVTYQDTNGDGSYDKFDYFAFNTTKATEEGKRQGDQQPKSSKRHQVTGKIKDTNIADLRKGAQRLVAQVATDENKSILVDLGAADKYTLVGKQETQSNNQQSSAKQIIKTGDRVTASGPLIKVGDKEVLLAQSAKVGDQQEQQINRSGRMINGRVAKMKTAKVRGEEHKLALLSLESGKQALVDLGAADQLNVKLAEGDQIGVNGVPVKVKNRLVILANSITKDGEKSKIDRVALKDKAKSGP